MRLSSAAFEAALRKKRQQRGESSQPAKRARVSAEAAVASAVPTTAGEPERKPRVTAAPKPAGATADEGEILATTEPAMVVLDEEEAPAAAEAPEAGRAAVMEKPPAVATPEAERASPAAEGRKVVTKRPRSRVETGGKKGGEPESSPHQAMHPPTRHPTDGLRGAVRRAPVLTSMADAGEAARLLHGLRTAGSDAELRGLSHSAVFDAVMVATLRAANGTLVLREAMAGISEALSKALARGEKYKRESAERAQAMARFQQEAQARERSLGSKIMETEGAAALTVTKLNSALERLKASEAGNEELARQLNGAMETARVAMEATAEAERQAAEARAEKAGAVACADEASVRAGEAEDRAREAENRAMEASARAEKAETGARQAVADYKASPQFMEEVIEAGLGAYVQGFEKCKEEVAKALKIDIASLDGVQPGGSEEEPAGGEAEAEEPRQGGEAGEPGPQDAEA